MKEEEKDLLLKDLCARLSYGVKAKANDITVVTINGIVKRQSLTGYFDYDIITDNGNFYLKEVKPYLRPMSSMTEEEKYQYSKTQWEYQADYCAPEYFDGLESYDWLNAHHFDYRGLIDKGLAIKVTEENNPYND